MRKVLKHYAARMRRDGASHAACSVLAALCASCLATDLAAAEPVVEMSASATNLVVTEQLVISFDLWLQGLDDKFEEQPPFLNQRPPHMNAPFLAPDWTSAPLQPANQDARQPFPDTGRQSRQEPAFTLNDYVSNDMFSSMGDPFGIMNDDFFGQSILGPKRRLFPFVTQRHAGNGSNIWHFTVSTMPYRAVSAGTVVLPPVSISIPLISAVRTVRDRFGRTVNVPALKEVQLVTKPLEIVVSAPPQEGRPQSFCGAICSNFSAKASLDTSVCTAGDPLVLTLDVSGPDDPSAVHPPVLAPFVTNGIFRLDDASVKTDTLSGARRFTWRVRAVKAGTMEFPSLPISFFNLTTRSYETVHTESIPIQVKAGAQAVLGSIDALDGEKKAMPMPDGIDFDPRGTAAQPFLPHLTLAMLLFILPPVLFMLARIAPPVHRRIAARNEAYRRTTAFARCRRALKSRNVSTRRDAIRRFFEVRYGMNGATVTAADAERIMSPDFSADEISLVVSALAEMDRSEYSAKKTLVSLAVLLSCVLGAAVLQADATSNLDFTYRRAGVLATRATGETGFREAADAYEACLKSGAVNPVLLLNLGTCRLLAGEVYAATAAYSRAERLCGETPSTRRGILAATARRMQDPNVDLPLARVFFRPHFLYSTDARLLFAACVWSLAWLAALLPPGSARRFLMTCGAILFVAAALSTSVSLVEEHIAEGGIHEKV